MKRVPTLAIERQAEPYRPPTGDPAEALIRELRDLVAGLMSAVDDAKAHTTREGTNLVLGEVARALDRDMPRRHWRFVVLTVVRALAAALIVVAALVWWLHPVCGRTRDGGYACSVWLAYPEEK